MNKIRTWQLLLLLFIAAGASIELLRMNNLGMIERREAVILADKQGDEAKVKQALVELQQYVSGHMNTDMGERGIYLEKTYQRAYERAVQEGVKNDRTSHDLYDKADQACQAEFRRTSSFQVYTECVAGKLTGTQANDPLANVKPPSVDLYRYTFISPLWAPDAAGLALLMAGVLLLVILLRYFPFFKRKRI